LREAETLYDASIRVWEMCFGGGYVASSQPLNNLASLYLQAGDPKRAPGLRRRAIGIRAAVLGHHHPGVARLQVNLAADLFSQRQYKKAELVCREFLPILPPNDRHRATALSTLAEARLKAKSYEEVIPLVNLVAAILQPALPADANILAKSLDTK